MNKRIEKRDQHDARVLATIKGFRRHGYGYGRICAALDRIADKMSGTGYIAWMKTRREEWETYPENTGWRAPGGGKWSKMAVKRICKRHGLQSVFRGWGHMTMTKTETGGRVSSSTCTECPRPTKRKGDRGRFPLTCSTDCHRMRISREAKARRVAARAGRICGECKGPIPYWRSAMAKTCGWRCKRARDRRRKAEEHRPGNGTCKRCRIDISDRRPNSVYCAICYRINDDYREKIHRRKRARPCAGCGCFSKELVPFSARGLCLMCLS